MAEANESRVRASKKRTGIPRAIRDSVLNEYDHKCAVCGAIRPQVHHIDENPGNNEPLNLIPLCPNCHLTDQHRPWQRLDPRRLRLFREFKDVTILRPQFEPLFRRMVFLDSIDATSETSHESEVRELIDFVQALAHGDFYASRLRALLELGMFAGVWSSDPGEVARMLTARRRRARDQLLTNRGEAKQLIVELLCYQPWAG